MNRETIIQPKIAEVDDQTLILLIGRNHDKEALAKLYDRYRHSLGGFLRRKLYQEKLVDEVYNDVMMTVWQKADKFRGDSKVSTWIFGIAYRMCLSQSRKEMKHTAGSVDFELNDLAEGAELELVGSIRAAITELSNDHRTVIELSYFYGHTVAEVSQMINCPVNTVKTRLFHARRKLKIIMQNERISVS